MKLSRGRLEAALMSTMAMLTERESIPVIIKPIAENGVNQKDCFYQHIKERRDIRVDECSLRQKNDFRAEDKAYIDALLQTIAARYPQVLFIDPQKIQCKNGVCATRVEGLPIYADDNHLNDYGGNWIGQRYLAEQENPLTN